MEKTKKLQHFQTINDVCFHAVLCLFCFCPFLPLPTFLPSIPLLWSFTFWLHLSSPLSFVFPANAGMHLHSKKPTNWPWILLPRWGHTETLCEAPVVIVVYCFLTWKHLCSPLCLHTFQLQKIVRLSDIYCCLFITVNLWHIRLLLTVNQHLFHVFWRHLSFPAVNFCENAQVFVFGSYLAHKQHNCVKNLQLKVKHSKLLVKKQMN